ncbi:MAG: DNA polymerase III subunit beta [Saprospiraceae bacterium]|jgi:DNA polymerase-3 subunit beta
MKFSVSSAELLKHLQLASGSIGSNQVFPILEDYLFTIKNNKLFVVASDMETFYTSYIEVMADAEGSIAIPAKILLDTLKALPQQPVTFTIDEDTKMVEITSAYGKYKIAGEDGSDYPAIPSPEMVNTFSIPSDVLEMGISKTIFATSTDELRPPMTGVLFEIESERLTLVATDAHKLVKFSYLGIDSDENASFIVPKKALNLIKSALPDNAPISVTFNDTNAFFSFGDTRLICRLIDAKYPDYNAVIPVDNPHLLTISKGDFQNSLKRIAIYSNKTTNQVILNIGKEILTLSAQDIDFSNEAIEELNCVFEGEPFTIGFNAKFLVEMLNVLESDEVKIELSTPTRAGILTPADQIEGTEILMLVMPVMLGN